MHGSPNVSRSPYVASVLGLIPGVGHLYLGRKARGLFMLVAAVLIALALVVCPALFAPGNARLIVLCTLLYFMMALPVMIVYSMLDAYYLASGAAVTASSTEATASTIGTWGWCLLLVGATGIIWVGLSNGGFDYLAVRVLPLALGLLGTWLVGTGAPLRITAAAAAPMRPRHVGRIAGVLALATVLVLLALGLVGRPLTGVVDLWGLVPLLAGLEVLIERERWVRGGRIWPLRMDDATVFIVVVTLVVGVVASPLRHMTTFPFTSTLQLPRIFNLAQPAYRVSDTDEGSSSSIPGEPVSFTYIYSGSGNVKIVGDPNATGVSPTLQTVARAESEAEAQAALSALTLTYGSSGPGQYWVTDDSVLPGWVPREPGRAEVTMDALFVVPAGVSVNVQIRFGQVQVVGVRGDVTVKTGFGQVDVMDCGGAVSVETGWGDVRVSGSARAVSATTDFGAVYCTADQVAGPVSLTTKIGGVRCSLPDGPGIDFAAETKQGSVRTDFPARSTRAYGSQSRSATLGDGSNQVRIETGFGDISVTIRK